MAPPKSAALDTSGAPPLPQSPDLVKKTIIRASGGNCSIFVTHPAHSVVTVMTELPGPSPYHCECLFGHQK